jgi:L-phenylalanine/L-methionine N-acetyltransferase
MPEPRLALPNAAAARCVDNCNVALRPRLPADSDALFDLFSEPSFQYFATGWTLFQTVAEMDRWFAGLSENRFEIVSCIDAELAGFAGCYMSHGRHSHVGVVSVAVAEKFQRRGVASLLLTALIAAADDLTDVTRLQLEVFADNRPAIQLYDKFGFEVEGRLRNYVRREAGFVDAFTMARLKPRRDRAAELSRGAPRPR